MSIADKVGEGASFSRARRSARGRAKAVTEGSVPSYELVRLQLDQVAPTPLNPRRNFGTDEDKTRFGEELRQAQLAACVAVSREAYLALWPDHAERIGDAQHVLVNGERRYHSAVHVGLEALDFVVRDDLAASREEFINHLLQENLAREDFDVIERARGVKQLVAVCAEQAERGARARAAERLGKDRSWVTNQLVLLDLPEEIQAMLSSGSLPERDGRVLARRVKDVPESDAAGLLEFLKASKEAQAEAKAQEKAEISALRSAAEDGLLSADNIQSGIRSSGEAEARPDHGGGRQTDELLSADNNSDEGDAALVRNGSSGEANGSADAGLLSADNKPARKSAAASPRVPAQQGLATDVTLVLRDPKQIAADLARHLSYEDLAALTDHLVEHVSTKA
ncbi:ParB/RepB/Spo0J family partition protein [Streptomyces sp. NPDC021749]|uniref:ParB/RepB/Spo0J family partition protein n=1 Tax=Streptomyces sp. NPDC021749 TaxID=3154905 RepID=UPI0033D2095D